jgi:uncharacterized protein YaaQ
MFNKTTIAIVPAIAFNLLCGVFAHGQDINVAAYTVTGKKILCVVDKNKPNIQLRKLLKDTKTPVDTDDVRSTNEYGETVWIVAARNNNLVAMKMLDSTKLYQSTDYTVADKDGNTAMIYAVNNSNVDMISYLAKHACEDDFNHANANGDSPVTLAHKAGGVVASTVDGLVTEAHRAGLAHLQVMHGDTQTLVLSHH